MEMSKNLSFILIHQSRCMKHMFYALARKNTCFAEFSLQQSGFCTGEYFYFIARKHEFLIFNALMT